VRKMFVFVCFRYWYAKRLFEIKLN
jgi:hypothetical protein